MLPLRLSFKVLGATSAYCQSFERQATLPVDGIKDSGEKDPFSDRGATSRGTGAYLEVSAISRTTSFATKKNNMAARLETKAVCARNYADAVDAGLFNTTPPGQNEGIVRAFTAFTFVILSLSLSLSRKALKDVPHL